MPAPEQQSQILTVQDLRRELGCGDHTARALARKLGRRLLSRRLIVTRVALERYLNAEGDAGDDEHRASQAR